MEKEKINIRMENFILENIKKVLEMDKEFIIIQVEIHMKVNGKIIKSNKNL